MPKGAPLHAPWTEYTNSVFLGGNWQNESKLQKCWPNVILYFYLTFLLNKRWIMLWCQTGPTCSRLSASPDVAMFAKVAAKMILFQQSQTLVVFNLNGHTVFLDWHKRRLKTKKICLKAYMYVKEVLRHSKYSFLPNHLISSYNQDFLCSVLMKFVCTRNQFP